MGQSSKDVKQRRTRIAGVSQPHPGHVGDSPDGSAREHQPLLRPIEGIKRAGSAGYLRKLQIGSPLFLSVNGDGSIAVYHAVTLLGWLGGPVEDIGVRVSAGDPMRCSLYSTGGTADEPTATVAVWL